MIRRPRICGFACQEAAIQTFVIQRNIRRFETLLAQALDPEQRRTVEALLAAERTKFEALETLSHDDEDAAAG